MADVFGAEFEDISTKKEAPLPSPKKERKYGDSDTDAFANEFEDIGKPSLWERGKEKVKALVSPIPPESWGGERTLAPREKIATGPVSPPSKEIADKLPEGLPEGSKLLSQKSKRGNPVYRSKEGKLYEMVRPDLDEVAKEMQGKPKGKYRVEGHLGTWDGKTFKWQEQ